MQYLEFFAVRADTGAALPFASLQAFVSGGGQSPAAIYDVNGAPVGVSVQADALGRIGLALPFGAYDLQITAGAYVAPPIRSVGFGDAMAVGLFTALSGLSVPLGVDLVRTTGHHVEGVGAALYAAVPATSLAPNAYTAQTANGRWFQLQESAPDVRQFGCVCDGYTSASSPTDDGPALQAALDWLSSRGGGFLNMPALSLATDTPIMWPSGVRLVGQGGLRYRTGMNSFADAWTAEPGCRIVAGPDFPMSTDASGNPDGPALITFDPDDDTSGLHPYFGLQSVTLDGRKRAASLVKLVGGAGQTERCLQLIDVAGQGACGDGIYLAATLTFRIDGLVMRACGGFGINQAYGACDSLVSNFWIQCCGRIAGGQLLGGGVGLGAGSVLTSYMNGKIENNYGIAVSSYNSASSTLVTFTNVTFQDNNGPVKAYDGGANNIVRTRGCTFLGNGNPATMSYGSEPAPPAPNPFEIANLYAENAVIDSVGDAFHGGAQVNYHASAYQSAGRCVVRCPQWVTPPAIANSYSDASTGAVASVIDDIDATGRPAFRAGPGVRRRKASVGASSSVTVTFTDVLNGVDPTQFGTDYFDLWPFTLKIAYVQYPQSTGASLVSYVAELAIGRIGVGAGAALGVQWSVASAPDAAVLAGVSMALANGDADLAVTLTTGAGWGQVSGDGFASLTLIEGGGANLGL